MTTITQLWDRGATVSAGWADGWVVVTPALAVLWDDLEAVLWDDGDYLLWDG